MCLRLRFFHSLLFRYSRLIDVDMVYCVLSTCCHRAVTFQRYFITARVIKTDIVLLNFQTTIKSNIKGSITSLYCCENIYFSMRRFVFFSEIQRFM